MFDPIQWIRDHFELHQANSAEFIYGTQETLSDFHQPGIYKPWDPTCNIHVHLRGRILDYAAMMANRRVLDFGPGEGYPSLVLAPFVAEVVGVDGSVKRVEECSGNAARIGIANASFVHVPPGQLLPFPDTSFDGAVASWSLEQSPDLAQTLREIRRVLRPGGIFRFEPETLGRYAAKHQQQVWLPDALGGFHGLTIFDRDIAGERVVHYGLLVDRGIIDRLTKRRGMPSLDVLTLEVLEGLRPHVLKAGTWTTHHPSFASWPRWLSEAGFATSRLTYSGGWMADRMIRCLPKDQRPATLQALDALLVPMARLAAEMDAPLPPPDGEDGLFITATKT
ncbi:MAG: class I SAM-dependent methyltransferase [Phycisphaerae bacterium]|jgi:SAM-dependent methyltransferase